MPHDRIYSSAGALQQCGGDGGLVHACERSGSVWVPLRCREETEGAGLQEDNGRHERWKNDSPQSYSLPKVISGMQAGVS